MKNETVENENLDETTKIVEKLVEERENAIKDIQHQDSGIEIDEKGEMFENEVSDKIMEEEVINEVTENKISEKDMIPVLQWMKKNAFVISDKKQFCDTQVETDPIERQELEQQLAENSQKKLIDFLDVMEDLSVYDLTEVISRATLAIRNKNA